MYMRSYKVTASFGSNTIKFGLPIGCRQETLKEALESARKIAREAFGFEEEMTFPDTLKVTLAEYYEE